MYLGCRRRRLLPPGLKEEGRAGRLPLGVPFLGRRACSGRQEGRSSGSLTHLLPFVFLFPFFVADRERFACQFVSACEFRGFVIASPKCSEVIVIVLWPSFFLRNRTVSVSFHQDAQEKKILDNVFSRTRRRRALHPTQHIHMHLEINLSKEKSKMLKHNVETAASSSRRSPQDGSITWAPKSISLKEEAATATF